MPDLFTPSFLPLSPPSFLHESLTSSSREYLTKSARSTRIRMVARNPVSSSTVTQLLTIENQWISRCCLRNWYLRYLSMRFSYVVSVAFHATL
jgi:hypothetical protein